MQMKVIDLGNFKTTRDKYGSTQPYAMAYCYPKTGPVLVKGMFEAVEKHVEQHIDKCHYFVRLIGPTRSKNSGLWRFNVRGLYHSKGKDERNGRERHVITIFNSATEKPTILYLRKMPNHYMKELE